MSAVECQTDAVAKPAEHVSPWIVAVLSAIIGGAVVAGAMMPMNNTPDYQRGHKDGYRMATTEHDEEVNIRMRKILFDGVRSGWLAKQKGEPYPTDPLD